MVRALRANDNSVGGAHALSNPHRAAAREPSAASEPWLEMAKALGINASVRVYY